MWTFRSSSLLRTIPKKFSGSRVLRRLPLSETDIRNVKQKLYRLDEGDHVANAFQVRELPTLVVIDANGVVSAVRSRMVHDDELEELISTASKSAGT